jgi:hypothetical protein
MTILVIYTSEPSFPPTDQNPDANRYEVGGLWVDATGTRPTQAEIDAILSPSAGVADQAAINDALSSPGMVVRALGLVMFSEINKLRVKNGDAAYTLNQFKAALLAQMR